MLVIVMLHYLYIMTSAVQIFEISDRIVSYYSI